MKTLLSIVSCFALTACVFHLDAPTTEAADDLVTVTHTTPVIMLSPHVGGHSKLHFRGKAYADPIGVGVGYVRIPGRDMIAFVTKPLGGEGTLHVLPIHGDGGFSVNIGKALFGEDLGRTDKSYPLIDFIESVRGDTVIFVTHSFAGSHHFRLDLARRSFTEID